jgi:outer membrane protein TolC
MTMQRRTLSITAAFFLLFLYHSATAQNTAPPAGTSADSLISQVSSGPAVLYNIQQCIDSALKNNPNVKTFEFTERTAKANYMGQIGTMLPTLYGTANYLNNGGKSINNFTNQYVTENYNQGTGQLYGGLTLWNGFSIHNFIRQYALAYQAPKKTGNTRKT